MPKKPSTSGVHPSTTLHKHNLDETGHKVAGGRHRRTSWSSQMELYVWASRCLWQTWWSPRHRQVTRLSDALASGSTRSSRDLRYSSANRNQRLPAEVLATLFARMVEVSTRRGPSHKSTSIGRPGATPEPVSERIGKHIGQLLPKFILDSGEIRLRTPLLGFLVAYPPKLTSTQCDVLSTDHVDYLASM